MLQRTLRPPHLAAATILAALGCTDADDPIVPSGPSTEAVVMGAVRTATGAAVAGATGQVNV